MEANVLPMVSNVLIRAFARLILLKLLVELMEQTEFANISQVLLLAD